MSSLIQLLSADSSEHLQALAEVSEFALTDMGFAGQGPWPYRRLTRPDVFTELCRLSEARSISSMNVDVLSFQPCLTAENQDRYVAQSWDLVDGAWTFCAVFDGHVDVHCVDYARDTLPTLIKESLVKALEESSTALVLPEMISQLLSAAVTTLDNNLTSQLMQIVPVDLTERDMTPDDVAQIEQADHSTAIPRCFSGSAVVCSLVDPAKANLWITSLGDCQAVLGLKDGTDWHGADVGVVHNTSSVEETRRLEKEHPGEPHCLTNGRVLGFLEPTRAIGDTWLKVSKDYIEGFFLHVKQDWVSNHTLRRCANSMQTPPYISNIPDVLHYPLSEQHQFILLCSDGLRELYDGQGQRLANHWASIIGRIEDSGEATNLAARLLEDAIGEDLTRASQLLTVEMEESWIDDTTIIIQRIRV